MHVGARQSHCHSADQPGAVGCRNGDAEPARRHTVCTWHRRRHLCCSADVARLEIHHDDVGTDTPLQLSGRALLHDPAVGQDRDPIRERVGLLQVLRGQEDRHAQLAVQAAHLLPDLRTAHRVEAGGGLVEEDHFRCMDERRRQVEAPLHAAAVGADTVVDGIADVRKVDGLGDGRGPVGGAQPVQAGLQVEDLAAGLLLVEGGLLHGHADADADLARVLGHVIAGHPC